MKFSVIKECVNKNTGQKMRPGQTVEKKDLGCFETGRLLAEESITPYVATKEDIAEKRIVTPTEVRRKPRRRKRTK